MHEALGERRYVGNGVIWCSWVMHGEEWCKMVQDMQYGAGEAAIMVPAQQKVAPEMHHGAPCRWCRLVECTSVLELPGARWYHLLPCTLHHRDRGKQGLASPGTLHSGTLHRHRLGPLCL